MSLGAEEALTLVDGENQEWLELANGCVCCTVKDNMLLTLEQLLKRSRDNGTPFDHIILETSGMADPGPLLEIFWVDTELEADVYLDAVVVVCDACHISDHVLKTKEAPLQLAFADRILLNKCDLVSRDVLQMALADIRSINSSALLIECSFGAVSLEQIVDIHAFDPERTSALSLSPAIQAQQLQRHSSDITTINVNLSGLLDKHSLEAALSTVLWSNTDAEAAVVCDVLRMKGVLSLKGKSTKYSLQCVRQTWSIDKTPMPLEFPPSSSVVVIGRGLDKVDWDAFLRNCLA